VDVVARPLAGGRVVPIALARAAGRRRGLVAEVPAGARLGRLAMVAVLVADRREEPAERPGVGAPGRVVGHLLEPRRGIEVPAEDLLRDDLAGLRVQLLVQLHGWLACLAASS
jgi:hypothetical protein